MSRGILSGVIFGAATGGVVVGVLSLYAPLSDDRMSVAEPEEQATPVDETGAADTASTAPAADATTAQTSAEVDADGDPQTQDTPDAVEEDGTESEQSAEAADAPAPDAQTDAPQAVAVAEESVATGTAVPTPDPAVTPADAPTLGEDEAEVAVTTPQAPTPPEELATSTQTPQEPAQDGDAPLVSDLADAPASAAPGSSGLSLPQVDAAPDADGAPAIRVIAAATPDADATQTAPEPDTESSAQATPVSADTPIILPVPKIDNPVAGVVTNRLPSVTAPAAEPAKDAVEDAVVDAAEVGALRAYAASYEGAPAAGQLSVILIDSGEDGMARDELVKLGFPFSIAIDPATPDAAQVAAEYRAAGIEVLAMLGDLPVSAAPGDVAVALEGYFGVLTEAIAVLDPLDGRIQSNRSLLQPVLGTIRDTGHGLVTYDRGLNTAQQAARREGIAAATVFRLLDAELEEGPKIKRYLSRAAFSAAKDGSVVVLGRSYPETVKALLEWSLDEKGGDLAIVPVSQVMLQDLG